MAEAEGLKRAEEADIHHHTTDRGLESTVGSPLNRWNFVQSYLAASLRLLKSAGVDCEGETCWLLVLYHDCILVVIEGYSLEDVISFEDIDMDTV